MTDIYFKKDTGVIFKFQRGSHDLANCKSRFTECDESGKAIVTGKKKKAGVKNG